MNENQIESAFPMKTTWDCHDFYFVAGKKFGARIILPSEVLLEVHRSINRLATSTDFQHCALNNSWIWIFTRIKTWFPSSLIFRPWKLSNIKLLPERGNHETRIVETPLWSHSVFCAGWSVLLLEGALWIHERRTVSSRPPRLPCSGGEDRDERGSYE